MKGYKMHNRSSLHQTLQQRVFGGLPPRMLLTEARGSKYLVQCLQKESALTGHEGCVNSIAWNDSGEYLLSGADDCLLNIYRPADRKLIQSIRSGHRANIFSAKFLPYTGDRKIVSCAGDGTIHFTDVDRESTFGQFQFDCHGGTTYEVITTPGDPNTFLSCGEDGTVRLFDLRTKTKCLCRSCKEDILIDCGKPVTSINLNPIMPYHLGVGCEDSTVRVFDRRALSSSRSNKMKGMFCQFKPEALTDRNYRVTSLHYSPNGGELLVSYCADYVYLFNVQGAKQCNSSFQDGIADSGFSSGSNGQRHVPPLKRLRLRGDWSDTGPNARPESEHPSPENSLMQRMSDMFARWLDESSRAGQRHRARRSSSRSASSSSSSVSASPSGLSSSSTESSGTSGTSGEEARRRRSHERSERPRSGSRRGRRPSGREQISNDDTMDLDQDSIATTQESNRSPQPAETKEEGSGPSTCTTSVELIPHCEKKDETSGSQLASRDSSCVTCTKNETRKMMTECNCNTNSNKRDSRNTSVFSKGTAFSRNVTKATGEQERLLQDESFDTNFGSSISEDNESTQHSDHSNADSVTHATKSCSVCLNNIELSAETKPDKPHSLGNTSVNRSLNKENLDASRKSGGLGTEEGTSQKATNDVSRNALDHTESSVPRNTRDYTHRTHANESSVYHDLDSVSSPMTQDDTRVSRPRVEANSYRTPHESFNESSSISDRTLAATRIQRVFRHHKNTKSFLKDDGDGVGVPKMVKVYKGHRNSRTMIKEANFWGDDYVLSGSDCGRIFIWDKYTAELVMILQGDKHVVNCVQPHPFDPILASSGIDYDIKLWAPISAEAMEPLDKEEIILRNEKMLEESRDTITVPASFMIRMLASLNNARFGQRNRDEDTDSDSSDD